MEAVKSNLIVIGLTPPGIEPESTSSVADARLKEGKILHCLPVLLVLEEI